MSNDTKIAEMMAEIEKLKAQNAQLQAKVQSPPKLTLKISEKGAVSLYGVGRFPVSMYAEQWTKVLDMADEIKGFIEANRAKLPSKEDSKARAKAEADAKADAERQARVASFQSGGEAHKVG